MKLDTEITNFVVTKDEDKLDEYTGYFIEFEAAIIHAYALHYMFKEHITNETNLVYPEKIKKWIEANEFVPTKRSICITKLNEQPTVEEEIKYLKRRVRTLELQMPGAFQKE